MVTLGETRRYLCRRRRGRRRKGGHGGHGQRRTPGAIQIIWAIAASTHLERVTDRHAAQAVAMARGHAFGIGLGDEGAGADVAGDIEGVTVGMGYSIPAEVVEVAIERDIGRRGQRLRGGRSGGGNGGVR